MFSKSILIGLTAFLIPSFAHAQTWVKGQEQEVDPGRYVTLYDSFDGWDIWKTETKLATSCFARKFEAGKRQLPAQSIFFSIGAGIGLNLTKTKEVYVSLLHQASPSYLGAEFRFDGERFPTDFNKASYVNYGDSLQKNQEQLNLFKSSSDQTVKIYTSDFEYRALRSGLEKLEADIPLKGIIHEAEIKLIECDASLSRPSGNKPA